jgi:hypothetical protein
VRPRNFLRMMGGMLRRIGAHKDTTRVTKKPWQRPSDATPRRVLWGRRLVCETFTGSKGWPTLKYRGKGRARRSWAETKAARPAKGGAR